MAAPRDRPAGGHSPRTVSLNEGIHPWIAPTAAAIVAAKFQTTSRHTIDAERAVLALLLLDPSRIAEVPAALEPADFGNEVNRTIYAAMLRLQSAGKPIDITLVGGELAIAASTTRRMAFRRYAEDFDCKDRPGTDWWRSISVGSTGDEFKFEHGHIDYVRPNKCLPEKRRAGFATSTIVQFNLLQRVPNSDYVTGDTAHMNML